MPNEFLWTVPVVNLKDRKYRKDGFRVPLPRRAAEIVREMEAIKVSDYVFPGQAPMKPLSNMALLTLLRRMNSVAGEKWVDVADGRRLRLTGSAQRSALGLRKPLAFRMR